MKIFDGVSCRICSCAQIWPGKYLFSSKTSPPLSFEWSVTNNNWGHTLLYKSGKIVALVFLSVHCSRERH